MGTGPCPDAGPDRADSVPAVKMQGGKGARRISAPRMRARGAPPQAAGGRVQDGTCPLRAGAPRGAACSARGPRRAASLALN